MTKTIWAKSGEPLTLPCGIPLPSNDNFELEWRKGSFLIYNAYGDSPGHSVAEYQGRLAKANKLGLTFHNIEETDHATYQCAVTKFARGTKVAPEFGPQIMVNVYASPSIQDPKTGQTLFITKGDTFVVNCSANGIPVPEIVWTKDGKVVSLNSTLKISNASASNTGVYSCHATNFEGTANENLVILLADSVTMRKDLSNKTVVEGSTVFWHCDAFGYPTNITYQWFKNQMPIASIELGLRSHIENGEFGISTVSSSDSGWYTCEASNGIYPSASTKAYLDVQYKPKLRKYNKKHYSLAVNHLAEIQCDVEANPPVTFMQWIKDGRPLVPSSSPAFVISNVTHADAGIYACQAFNAIGSSSVFEIHVTVSEPPQFSKYPPPVAFVEAGESVELECSGFGDPPPVQYWLHKMVRSPGGVLKIKNVSFEDHGVYKCILANAVANIHKEVTLFVKNAPPECPKSSNVTCHGDTGFQVMFDPGYDGGHPTKFTLEHRQVNIQGLPLTDWNLVDLDQKSFTTVETDTPFSFHDFQLRASNMKGSTLCSMGIKNVCSKPSPPTALTFDSSNVLHWKSSENAKSYKVAFRRDENQPFVTLAETKKTYLPFEDEFFSKSATLNEKLEVTVRSMHYPFPESEPAVALRTPYTSDFPTNTIAIVVIALLVSLFTLFWTCRRRNKKGNNIKFGGSVDTTTLHSCHQTARGNGFCQPLAPNISYDIEQWDVDGNGNDDNDTDLDESENVFTEEAASAVNSMLRQKYMDNPEYQKLNLLDELRLEKLKQEFCTYGIQ